MKEAEYICGIDGGGSGCRVAIATTEGTVVGSASGGPANFTTNRELAVDNVIEAIQRAATEAGLGADELARCVAYAGLAGVMDAVDANALAAGLPFDDCSTSDDRPTMLTGALAEHDGALCAIGTGSFVAVQQGEVQRFFGGWGLQLGDQASGAWLGRGVLEQTLLACDGLASESALTRQVMARFNDAPADIVVFAGNAVADEFASFAPDVVNAASAGDTNGTALMQRGASYLDECLRAVNLSPDARLCLSGGVGPHYAPFLGEEFRSRIHKAEGTALDGALALARRKLGCST